MAEGSSSSGPGTSDSSTLDSSAPATPTILNKLKAPRLSELHRKRKVHANPPKGKRRPKGEGADEPNGQHESVGRQIPQGVSNCLPQQPLLHCLS